MRPEHVILCDTKGVVYQGRTEGMNQWKSAHAVDTKARTLADAWTGADVFFGLSVKGALTQDMVGPWPRSRSSSPWPIPDPEIRPRRRARPARTRSSPPAAATIPTRSTTFSVSPTSSAARSMSARTINEAMKIAAAEALAKLAREDVPDEVHAAYQPVGG